MERLDTDTANSCARRGARVTLTPRRARRPGVAWCRTRLTAAARKPSVIAPLPPPALVSRVRPRQGTGVVRWWSYPGLFLSSSCWFYCSLGFVMPCCKVVMLSFCSRFPVVDIAYPSIERPCSVLSSTSSFVFNGAFTELPLQLLAMFSFLTTLVDM